MRPTEFSTLLQLAREARRRTELLSKQEGGKENLSGYCAVGSSYLHRIAAQNDIDTTFVVGRFLRYCRITNEFVNICGHAWVEYRDRIIDITATQFVDTVSNVERNFNKKVYVCAKTCPHYDGYQSNGIAIKSIKRWYPDERLEDTFNRLEGFDD